MPTFRHFVAIGVGTAITLSVMESYGSRDLPSLTQPSRDQSKSRKVGSAVAPVQGAVIASSQTRQKVDSPALENNHATRTSDSGVVPLISPTSEQPKVGSPAEEAAVGKQALTSGSTAAQGNAADINRPESSNSATDQRSRGAQEQRGEGDCNVTPCTQSQATVVNAREKENIGDENVKRNVARLPDSQGPGFVLGVAPVFPVSPVLTKASALFRSDSVDASTSKQAVIPTYESVKPPEETVTNSVLTLRGAVSPTTTAALETPQNASSSADTKFRSNVILALAPQSPISPSPYSTEVLSLNATRYEEGTGKAVSPYGGGNIAQSPVPGTSQLPPGNQATPVPESLNPNPNPLLFPTQSQEVQVQSTQPITLQQAIELARRNNRQLQAAQLALERTQFVLQEALAAEFPTAGLQADFTRTDSAQTSLSNARQAQQPSPLNRISDPVSASFNTALQLSYDLFTAGRRPAQIRAAEQQVRFQQLEVESLSQQLRLEVSNAYYALQQADATVDINQAAVTDAAQSLRDAQLLEQAGLGTRFDVLQAQVQLANANQDLIRSLSQQRVARRRIVQLLSLAQSAEVSAADPIEVAGAWNLSLEQSIVLAYKNRAELEQQLVQRDIDEQRRRVEQAATRPQVSLTASYNILGVLNDGVGPEDGLSLGARLRWDFFDGGRTKARVNQQRSNIAIDETNFANQRNQVRFEVEQAFSDLNSNAQNIQTASFALVQAQESLRLARLRFQAGVGTQTDVINQQTELTRARGNRLTAILDYNRALASLQRAVSNLPDSNLFDLPDLP